MKCKSCDKIVYEEDVLKWCGVEVCPKCYERITKAWKEYGEQISKS